MKLTFSPLSTAAAVCLCTLSATALSLQDVPAGQEQAKKENKPLLVLWHGSDWMGSADKELQSEWEKLKAEQLPVVLAQYDDKLGQDRPARKKVLPVTEFNLPCAVLLLPDGTLFTTYTGKNVRTAKGMLKVLSKSEAKLKSFRALTEKAKAAKGVEAATAAGQALALLSFEDARRCGSLKEIIQRQDPKDETGYHEVFLQGHENVINALSAKMEEGGKKGKNRDFAAAAAMAEKVLAQKNLTKEAEQRWLAGLAYVQREKFNEEGNNDWKAFRATCERIVKVDAKSDYADGARFFLHYYDTKKPFIITHGYYNRDVMPKFFEKPWEVDVSSALNGGGTYTFRLKPDEKTSDRLVTKDFILSIDGKTVDKVSKEIKYGDPVTFKVPASAPKKGKMTVQCTVRCNDGGLNCSGYIEMKKEP